MYSARLVFIVLSKIKVTWEPEQLIFSDGEKVSLE